VGEGKIETEKQGNRETGREPEMERRAEATLKSYKDLRVYQGAMDACMEVFVLSKRFPAEERYSLADQIRRSSRSVCANLAEAWRNRRHRAAFIAKLDDALGEASESQVWLEIARRCGFWSEPEAGKLDQAYDRISAQIVSMIQTTDKWLVPTPEQRATVSKVARG
jgi:four helix bundle protein